MPRFTKPLIVTLWGVAFPVPRWTVFAFGVLVPIGAAVHLYRQAFPPDGLELVTLRQANAQLAAEVAEYQAHIAEDPVRSEALFDDVRGQLSIRVFSDGCIVLLRRSQQRTLTRLVLDLAKDMRSSGPTANAEHAHDAAQRCLNPHPGQFRWWYGQRLDRCWVEVYRQWPDGCTHV